MKEFVFIFGRNYYDFFIVPTVRIHIASKIDNYVTIDWLRWYVGIKWFEDAF